MKKEILLLIFGMFLIIFIIGEVSSYVEIPGYGMVIRNVTRVGDDTRCLHIDTYAGEQHNYINISEICFNTISQTTNSSSWFPDLISTYAVTYGKITFHYQDRYFYSSGIEHGSVGYHGGNILNIISDSQTWFYLDLISPDGSVFVVRFVINLNNQSSENYGSLVFRGYILEDNSEKISSIEQNQSYQFQRISSLESNMTLLQSWKQTITDTITSILNTLTGHNTRISKLENSTSNGTTIINNTTIIVSNGTNPYLKYLGSSDRKNMVCGYAVSNHLTTISDLGWVCNITYKQTSRGETSSCKCKGK